MFGAEHERLLLRAGEVQLRERLSQNLVDDLLSFVGNSEIKLATLLSIDPQKTYSGHEVYEVLPHRYIRSPNSGGGWHIGRPLLEYYCMFSFIPVGFVRETQQLSKRLPAKMVTAYGKTLEGGVMGDEFGGLVLHFSSRHLDTSLYQLLGATNSSAKMTAEFAEDRKRVKRSPAVRRRFYQALLLDDMILPTRVIDVATEMEERPSLIADHARRAGENDIIVFNSIEHGVSVSAYRLLPRTEGAARPAYCKEGYFPHVVYTAFVANPQRWWTIEEVTELLLRTRPAAMIRGTEEESRRTNMKQQAAKTLSHLRDKGYLAVRDFDRSHFSSITLTSEQKALLQEFLDYIDAFQNQDPKALMCGRNFAQQLREDPQLLAQLVLKGKGTSPNAGKNATTTEIIMDAVREVVRVYPKQTTSRLQKILRAKGIRLSVKSVRIYLENMEASSIRDKSGLRWTIAKDAAFVR